MISNLTQELWDKKTIELGGSILQSFAWGEFQQSLGQKIHRFSGDDFVNLGIETDLPLGKKFVYCPRGPLGNIDAALDDLKKLDSDHSIIFSRVEPGQIVRLPRAVKDIQPVNNWMLSLSAEGGSASGGEKTEEELLISMKPKTRYNINLAQRKGVTVRQAGWQDLIQVWQLFMETAGRNKIKLHPQDYYFKMWEHLEPQYLKILIAEYKGQALSAMILTLFGSTATYLHGGTSVKMKEAMSPYVLHWEAIKLAKNSGMKFYDFGGIAPDGEKDHSWAGITRFKKGFGGFEVNYPGSFDLIFSPIWYNVYKQGRKLLRGYR
ncbi:MAG: peptidoglycan bridge formation glycyltransferase FemA/FemB family protein [Candidatus Doudnabacteria bacterium]